MNKKDKQKSKIEYILEWLSIGYDESIRHLLFGFMFIFIMTEHVIPQSPHPLILIISMLIVVIGIVATNFKEVLYSNDN